MYGTVCTVVWEDGGGNPASYPILPARLFDGVGILFQFLGAVQGRIVTGNEGILFVECWQREFQRLELCRANTCFGCVART